MRGLNKVKGAIRIYIALRDRRMWLWQRKSCCLLAQWKGKDLKSCLGLVIVWSLNVTGAKARLFGFLLAANARKHLAQNHSRGKILFPMPATFIQISCARVAFWWNNDPKFHNSLGMNECVSQLEQLKWVSEISAKNVPYAMRVHLEQEGAPPEAGRRSPRSSSNEIYIPRLR